MSMLPALLRVHWKEDEVIQEKSAAKDMVLLKLLSSLIIDTSSREKIVSRISEKLEKEVAMVGEFIEKVATHRPPG